jgi:hypothetical protein
MIMIIFGLTSSEAESGTQPENVARKVIHIIRIEGREGFLANLTNRLNLGSSGWDILHKINFPAPKSH